jgi:hypothetical protein
MPATFYAVKHKATGIPAIIPGYEMLPAENIKRCAEYPGEVHHALFREKIAKNPKLRKRGIWQHDKDDRYTVYFTCPWCTGIGKTSDSRVGPQYGGESIFCRKCKRHLTLFYLERADVKIVEVK